MKEKRNQKDGRFIHFMFCTDGRTNMLKVLVKSSKIFQVIRDLGVYDMTTEQLTTLDRKQSVKMMEFNFLLKQTKKNPVGASFDLRRNL